MWRKSERAFQHHCRLERCDVVGRISACHDAYTHSRHTYRGNEHWVVGQRNAAHGQLLHERPLCDEPADTYSNDECYERHSDGFNHEVHPQFAHSLAQTAPCVDTLDAHGAFGQHEVEAVDGCNDEHQQACQLQNHIDRLVASVLFWINACKPSVGHGAQVDLHLLVLHFLPSVAYSIFHIPLMHLFLCTFGYRAASLVDVGIAVEAEEANIVVIMLVTLVFVVHIGIYRVLHDAVGWEVFKHSPHINAVAGVPKHVFACRIFGSEIANSYRCRYDYSALIVVAPADMAIDHIGSEGDEGVV